MFDAADLVALPELIGTRNASSGTRESFVGAESVEVPSTSGQGPDKTTSLSEGTVAAVAEGAAAAAAASSTAVPTVQARHVVEACAMGEDNVALAMSDGELCHTKLSRLTESVRAAERQCPNQPSWTSWRSKHGSVLHLQYDPAHDALVTLEHGTTAAGDQVFLGRYHRLADRGRGEPKGGASEGMPWIGCSIPLAMSHACIAVCPFRGWAAVCTGSVVNLWAVARAGLEPSNGATGGAPGSSRPKQAPLGFEHALAVDLTALFGVRGGVGKDGGAKHIALLGNTLAVATDHAVFLLGLSFDVKGETPSRLSNTAVTDGASPPTPTSRPESQQPPSPATPQSHSSRSSPRDKSAASLRSSTSSTTKSHATDFPPKVASRGSGLSSNSVSASNSKGHSAGSPEEEARGDRGSRRALLAESRKDSGRWKSERGDGWRDGPVEGRVLDAEDMVVCVLHPGGDEGERGADGSAQSPPLLRAFSDDWEAFRARGHRSTQPWELETDPVLTESSSVSLPVTGNSTVLDRVGDCEVLLARRVGPGEVVKELHLLPVSARDDGCPDANSHGGAPRPSPDSCRFVLLTSKGATVCLVCAGRAASSAAPSTPPTMSRVSSFGSTPSQTPTSPPPTLSRGEGSGRSDGSARGGHASLGVNNRSPVRARRGFRLDGDVSEQGGPGATADGAEHDAAQQVVVYLRRSCRFNSDLVRASIASGFLFVLTVEGLEVWTFPSDRQPVTDQRRGHWCADSRAGGRQGTSLFTPPDPSPRPCLLHVQKLEVDGVMPRSPATCMVSIQGKRPGVLLFPSSIHDQGTSLAFLARRGQRCLRSRDAADKSVAKDSPAALKLPLPPPPPPPPNPFAAPLGHDADASWLRKCTAWHTGFCGLGGGASVSGSGGGGGGRNAASGASSLALFIHLKTPTAAFRLLAAAEARSPRPLSPTVSAMFVSAAEGLHGALVAEATAAWHAAVCPASGRSDAGIGLVGRRGAPACTNNGGIPAASGVGIETILADLVTCWRLQRVSARCASLIGRLLLEASATVATAPEDGSLAVQDTAAARQAYTRACLWLRASGESAVECFALLTETAARVSEAGSSGSDDGEEVERAVEAPSLISLEDDEDDDSCASTFGTSSVSLEEALSAAMYEAYLLPALGIGGASGSQAALLAPAPELTPFVARDKQLPSFDGVLSSLVAYLHGQDMRRFSLPADPRHSEDGARRPTSLLSAAVVYAGCVPWTACPAALSQALLALDQQEKALAERASNVRSSRSNSGGSNAASTPGKKASPGGVSRSSLAGKGRRRREKHDSAEPSGAGAGAAALDDRDPAEHESTPPPALEWVAVSQAILRGYAREMDGSFATPATAASTGKPLARPLGAVALAADERILQLACERHPTLVAPVGSESGFLAKSLLEGGRARPVVAALVRLTTCGGCDEPTGCREGASGPHRAQELLQLTGDVFSPMVDTLQALRVFGAPGRQIAGRLDSLRRASLDVSGSYSSSPDVHSSQLDTLDGDAHEHGSDAVDSRPNRSGGDTKALMAAAREFLSRRCAASLASADSGTRHEERLSEALGAPRAWQLSLARNHALDRAILRYLIGAHLDDLRALETSAAGKPKATRDTPKANPGWGSKTGFTAIFSSSIGSSSRGGRKRSGRDGEKASWADTIVPLLTGQVPKGRGGPAEEHLDAIMFLVREVTWRGSADNAPRGDDVNDASGRSMSPEEAAEVATEAKRRLPVTAPAPASSAGDSSVDDGRGLTADETSPWGSGGAGKGVRRAPWPWGPRAVPPSAVGAVLALAAALPPAGKLLAGVDVMLQVAAEVIAAARAEAAVAAGAAAASGSAGKGGARRARGAQGDARATPEALASVEEVSSAAEKALLLYASEYCGKDPDRWASVTDHVRCTGHEPERLSTGSSPGEEGGDVAGQKLVRALLRRCGEELGGIALVRALPDSLDLMECLEEVERSLLQE